MNEEKLVSSRDLWDHFFYQDEIRGRVREFEDLYPDGNSIAVSFAEVDYYNSDLAIALLDEPEVQLEGARRSLQGIFKDPELEPRFVITDLPRDAHVLLKDVRHNHIEKMIAVDGLIKKVTVVQPLLSEALYICPKCGKEHYIKQDSPGYHEGAIACQKDRDGCGNNKLILDYRHSIFRNVQKVEVQETPEGLRGGQPHHLDVYLRDDMAGIVQPGQKATVAGVLRVNVQGERPKTNILEYVMDGISIKSDEEDEIVITPEDEQAIKELSRSKDLFKMLRGSICPAIYGYDIEKEALILQSVGGVTKHLDDGTRLRGDIHILLVGDPGVAKSLMLRHMADLSPRGVYVSGKASTAAGLTATATKDEWGEGRWTLEAGALVLADGGYASVDEMDKMSDQDRSSMHEIMESGRVSVAKAGIVATLNARCPILGAANPKRGRFLPEKDSLAEQIDMPPTLLSRFDLIFALTDRPVRDKDESIARHILNSHLRGEALMDGDKAVLERTQAIAPAIDADFLRKYIVYAKRLSPRMTPKAMSIIEKAYVTLRGKSRDGTLTVTARQLEAYIRLAEASARLRLSSKVEAQDAERASAIIAHYLDGITGGDIDMVVADIPHSKREKLEAIKSLIKGSESGLSRVELEDLGAEKGILETEVQAMIAKLSQSGEIWDNNGKWMVVKE